MMGAWDSFIFGLGARLGSIAGEILFAAAIILIFAACIVLCIRADKWLHRNDTRQRRLQK